MASLMRTDGTLVVYTIKHVSVSNASLLEPLPVLEFGWENTGNCSQFPRRNRKMELYKPIQAGGAIWQKYGIAATTVRAEAEAIAEDMRANFPDHHFAVAEVCLSQLTRIMTIFAQEAEHA